MVHQTSTLDSELRLGNGASHREDSHWGVEQAAKQEQVSIQETRSLFQKALLKLSLEQNGLAMGDELSRTGPRNWQDGSPRRNQAYLDGALKGFEKLVRTASGAGIPLRALHQPLVNAELRRRMAMQSEGSTEDDSGNLEAQELFPQRVSASEQSDQRGPYQREDEARASYQRQDDARLTRCLEGRCVSVGAQEGAFAQGRDGVKESGQESGGGEEERVSDGFRNESGSDWESSKGNSPTWASSEEWQAKSETCTGVSKNRTVSGREDKGVLEGLAKCQLEDSEKGDAHLTKVGSNGHDNDGASSKSQGDPPSETCEQRTGSMRWRGGTSAGDADVSKSGVDVSGDVSKSGADISDRGGDISSEGSYRKRAREEAGDTEEEAGDTGDGRETPPRPGSPSRTSSGEFQRLKGGAGAGKEDPGGNGSNESTVQSGHKRKQADSESYESVRQPGDEKRRDLYPARYHTDSRYPGVVRVSDIKDVRDEQTGDWKRIADGLRTVYECRFCQKRFLVSQALGGHMNKHRDEKEKEKARLKALELVIPDKFGQPESTKTTPPFQGTSISSPSTPLNLSDPWTVQQPTPKLRPLPPAALPSPSSTKPAQTFQLSQHASSPHAGTAAPAAASAADPRVGMTYEAGFEAGFGAGLVALARAGLLVPDAAMALGWQDMSGWGGGRADAAAAAAAADMAPMEQQLFPVDPPLLGSPPNKRLAAAAAAAPSLEKFVLQPPRDEPSELEKFVMQQPRNVPSEPPVPAPLVTPQPFDVKLGAESAGELGGGLGAKGPPPAVTPVWIETPRGTEQVFQVDRVQGLDKGLYALKPVDSGAPPGGSIFSVNDLNYLGGRTERQTDPPGAFVSAQKPPGPSIMSSNDRNYLGGRLERQTEPPVAFGSVQRARPEEGVSGYPNGAGFANQGGFGAYERRRSLASSKSAHPLMPRGNMSAAVRPTVGYVDKYMPQGFRSATPEALPVSTGRYRYEGTYQATTFGENRFGKTAFGETAFGKTAFGDTNAFDKPRVSPRSDGPAIPLSGTTGTTSSNGTAVSTDEKPDVGTTRDDIIGSRGVSPALSSPPPLVLAREASDIYHEILQSQPSGFSKELGDASLGGSFDEQLCSFAQDHPDWPDYFQGGSVNSGDAFGLGDKAAG